MKVLVTGSAGFIGFFLVKALIARGDDVIGIDNLNNYYNSALKQARLSELDRLSHESEANYKFILLDMSNREGMAALFREHEFEIVVNLGAQAGVRYSIDNPHSYVDSNLVGFVNVLEGCRTTHVKHLVYASSSSVYGMNVQMPFNIEDRVDHPISLYAATKKSNELMAHTYSHLYAIPTTGLRFFTVYGPWGRPDMAYFKFTKAIMRGEPIDVYNHGMMKRDFTYIDDIIEGVLRVMARIPTMQSNSLTNAQAPYRIYNIGNNQPVTLREFIRAIETACDKKAVENHLPMQPGDVPITYANIDSLIVDAGFKPLTNINDGIKEFVNWYLKTYPHV